MRKNEIKATAFLFDMDGTLVDSRPVVEHILGAFAKKYKLNLQTVIEYAHGRQSIDTMTHFLGNNDNAIKEAKFIDSEECKPESLKYIKAMPGAKALLESISVDDWILVTSAGRELALGRMKAAQLPIPTITICSEDVKRGKPNPDAYLLAASKINKPISSCVVFEDAEAGIQAGVSSGAQVFAVNGFVQSVPDSVISVESLAKFKIRKEDGGFIINF